MPKFGVTITYTETAYKEVEAESEEEACRMVERMDQSEYEPMGDDDIEFEAEEIYE